MKKTEDVNEGEVAAYHHDGGNCDDEDAEVAGLCWLPAELWAMVCEYLGTADLARLSTTCWTLRSHAFARVRHHTFTPLGLVTSRNIMRRALAFVATLPSLESLSLSAWDSFPDALVGHLPEALEGLDLSYTAITNRGVARLPVGLTRLDLSGTHVASTSLRALSRLSSLRDLTLTNISGLSARHLQGLPASVEVLDLANCSGPFAKQELLGDPADNPATPALTLPRVPWPPALRELKLGGVRLSLGLLYGMPTTLESLDISHCILRPVPVDMDACLPRLQTFRADNAGLDLCAYHLYRHTAMWSLPSGLKLLSLAGMPLDSPTDRPLAFLPASITSLDISRTPLIQDQYSHVSHSSAGWFHTLPKRLPHLRLLNLTMPWPCGNPQCLEIMKENNVTVIFGNRYPSYYQPGVGQISDPVPREQDPKWVDFVKLCAEEQRRITWRDLPDEADHDHNEGDADEADHDNKDDDNDDDDDEEEQGSLLFMGL